MSAAHLQDIIDKKFLVLGCDDLNTASARGCAKKTTLQKATVTVHFLVVDQLKHDM